MAFDEWAKAICWMRNKLLIKTRHKIDKHFKNIYAIEDGGGSDRLGDRLTLFRNARGQDLVLAGAEDALLDRKLPDQKVLHLLNGVAGMSGAMEGDSGVPSGMVHDDVVTARVFPQEVGDVVDPVVDHHPAVVEAVVLGHLLQGDLRQDLGRLQSVFLAGHHHHFGARLAVSQGHDAEGLQEVCQSRRHDFHFAIICFIYVVQRVL